MNNSVEVCYKNACVKGTGKYADQMILIIACALMIAAIGYAASKIS